MDKEELQEALGEALDGFRAQYTTIHEQQAIIDEHGETIKQYAEQCADMKAKIEGIIKISRDTESHYQAKIDKAAKLLEFYHGGRPYGTYARAALAELKGEDNG